jgi:hypothetical protein
MHQKATSAMNDYVKQAVSAGDQYLSALAEAEQNFLKSAAAFAASIPTAPSMPDLPTPLELVETNFAFTEKLLKQQKAFTEKLFAISTPATGTGAKSAATHKR